MVAPKMQKKVEIASPGASGASGAPFASPWGRRAAGRGVRLHRIYLLISIFFILVICFQFFFASKQGIKNLII